MTNELDALLEVPGRVPIPEVGPRVLEVLRRSHGADESAVERPRGWCAQLARRLRGQGPLVPPADPLQRPTVLYLDGFDDHAWHDPTQYPVLTLFEEAASAIQSEFFDRTTSPEQWPEYREGGAAQGTWRARWFYRGGRRIPTTADLYPRTSALIDEHSGPHGPLASTLGDVFLSRIEAKGRIPAHNGLCNISLVGHLALKIPPQCGMRVGSESRTWEEGKCLVFDDTFEHEVWNKSEEDRYILVFVLWQNGVTPIEREFMNVMTSWLNKVAAHASGGARR